MLLCIVGPTACYKTNTAIYLAERCNGEIISCDSVAVYKGLDIGSAKPTAEEQKRVPHHMIDVADPFDRSFTVSEYQKLADAAILSCTSRQKLPIVCGGSGLYFDAIMHEMNYACPSSAEIRKTLEEEYDADPSAFLQKLDKVDPVTARRIPIRDKKRLVRAMEVYASSGKPFSFFNRQYEEAQHTFRYRSVRIGLNLPREALYERINERVDRMLQAGLLEEVESLHKRGLCKDYPSMQSIGYKQMLSYIEGNCTYSEAVEEIKKASRHLAKRQLTWFKRDEETRWFDCSDQEECLKSILDYVMERIHE